MWGEHDIQGPEYQFIYKNHVVIMQYHSQFIAFFDWKSPNKRSFVRFARELQAVEISCLEDVFGLSNRYKVIGVPISEAVKENIDKRGE